MTIPRHIVRSVTDLYTIFVLALSTDALLPVLARGSDSHDLTNGSPIMQAAWGIIYAITIISLARRRGQGLIKTLSNVRANKPLACLVLLAFVSLLWSVDAILTFHSVVILVFSALFAIDLSARYTLTRQVRLIAITFALLVGVSVILELFFPGTIPRADSEGLAWHGVFANKNQLGRMADLGVIAYLALPGRAKWTKALVVAVGIIIGLLAQSAGALGYLIAIVVLYMWSSTLTWRPTQRKVAIVASATLAVAIIFVASQNIASETAMIGKDSTLTGRTDLWKLSLRAVEERPLWGYGYGAFWGKNSPRARPIREEVNWGAPHAHDGYIDLALELGFVGILIYAIMMFTMMKRAYRAYVQTGNSVTQWPLLYLVFISLYQLTESSIITGDYILWILLCSLACYPAEACASRAHEVVTESPSNARLLLA